MRKRFHNLKRPKIRADWSKWTLYNTWRISYEPAINRNPKNKTFFQQKWKAKAMTRAYHGEQIREGQWSRMFDRRLPSVVPMPPRLLAESDGSEMSAGRGAGLDQRRADPSGEDEDQAADKRKSRWKSAPPGTPYMHMTFWPTERRLDTAVWRALFASSVRQARQFVVHGNVTVNGKLMRTPGYLLNPGDLFSVDPERVMYATGARKFSKDSPETLQQSKSGTVGTDRGEDAADAVDVIEAAGDEAEDAAATTTTETKISGDGEATVEADKSTESGPAAGSGEHIKVLRGLLGRAKDIILNEKELSGKRKGELRELTRDIKQTLSRFRGTELKPSKQAQDERPIQDSIASFGETLAAVVAKIPEMKLGDSPAAAHGEDETAHGDETVRGNETVRGEDETALLRTDAEALTRAVAAARANPIDASKPYATPWRPREFMRAFAFIPRYLEVHPKICSAVYLRHPVARPGLAEVPSPFTSETMQLAHNWYLRRR